MQNKWIRNQTNDPELNDVCYSFHSVYQQLEYLQNSWVWQEKKVKIAIFGGDNWLSHYLIHFYTEYNFPLEIYFFSFETPDFISFSRYKKVQFIQIHNTHEIEKHIEGIHVLFYADNERDIAETSFLRLYSKNVSQVEKICQILKQYKIPKCILFSDSCVYRGATEEGATTNADLPLGKSFEEMEQVSLQYHTPQKFEVYCLRLAPVCGIKVTDGIMKIAHLMANGYILGPIEGIDKVSFVCAEDVMLVSMLVLARSQTRISNF